MQIYMKGGKALKVTGGGYLAPKSETETWVLIDNYSVSFKYLQELPSDEIVCDFLSNGIPFHKLASVVRKMTPMLGYIDDSGNTTYVYDYEISRWENQSYRTLTFTTPPTGDLLTWLQANGTKQ